MSKAKEQLTLPGGWEQGLWQAEDYSWLCRGQLVTI